MKGDLVGLAWETRAGGVGMSRVCDENLSGYKERRAVAIVIVDRSRICSAIESNMRQAGSELNSSCEGSWNSKLN